MMKYSVFCLAVTMALASMSVQAYTAGTYEAETSGLNGPIKVQVTVTADAITAVKVLAQRETDGIGSKAIELPMRSNLPLVRHWQRLAAKRLTKLNLNPVLIRPARTATTTISMWK